MKKVWIILAACLLAGCGAEPTFETVADEMVYDRAAPRQIRVSLPEDTVLPVMETDGGKLYICRDYEVAVQTLPGGDLRTTVTSLCGLPDVSVVESAADGFTRYDFVWASAGETGAQVGRAGIISDGVYHYCLSAMAPEEYAESLREIWNGMFESFTVA